MARYAIVRNSDGFVLNIIEWDGVAQFDAGAENTLVAIGSGHAQNGMLYQDSAFVPGPPTVFTKLSMLATSTLVVKKVDITTTTWDELGVVTSTPAFFCPTLERLLGRVVGTVKSTGAGLELQIVEEKDDGTRTVLTPTPFSPTVDSSFKAFGFSTAVPPSQGQNRYILEGRLVDAQATASIKGTSLSVMLLSP
ncbi:MAG TPA: hypothetical protein VLI71_07820 [Gammaproteobacteria bacterium]|nr:hypothetical protein [Gammaproteobacteria bacterium]